jgi:hypothetical protein
MKVFVSYSFQDSELYIVALLFDQLQQKGFLVESSDYFYPNQFTNNHYKIISSDYFIGIITNNTDSVTGVITEWEVAKNNNKQNILIVEDGVKVENPHALNFIRFNRSSPQIAINQVLMPGRLAPASQHPQENMLENVLAVGTIAIGLAALISLLSGKNKKH